MGKNSGQLSIDLSCFRQRVQLWTQGTSQASLCVVSAERRFAHLETGSRAGAENRVSVNIHRGPGNDPELTSEPSRGDKHDKVLKNRSSWVSEMTQY